MTMRIKCRDGTLFIDDRLSVEEWLEKTHGPDVRLEQLAVSGDQLVATISYPETIFPSAHVRIKPVNFVDVPDDVTFRLTQVTGGEFVKTYSANRETSGTRVFVKQADAKFENTIELDPAPSLAIVNHSPTGFEWGYGGSGPAQLALAILLDVTGDRELAEKLHQDFKWKFIANLPAEKWQLREDDVRQWVKNSAEGVLL